MSVTQNSRLLAALSQITSTVEAGKQAAAKLAAGEDPGGREGASTHPSAKVDNGTTDPSKGPRYQENTTDVKAQEKAPSVENGSAPSPTADQQAQVQLDIGLKATGVGDNPAIENDYKDKKDDPGTSLSQTDLSKNEKYSSIKQAHAELLPLAHAILADFAAAAEQPASKAAAAPATPATPAAPAATPAAAAAEAGYDLANLFGLSSKEAAYAQAEDSILAVVKEACDAADMVADYLKTRAQAQAKAAGDENPKKDHSGKAPADAGGLLGESGGSDNDGDGDGDGAPMPLDTGSAPAGPGGPGGDGGSMDKDQAMQELAAALDELGIDPRQLLDALTQGGDPGAGGAPPMDPAAGGAPPMDPAAMGGGAPPVDPAAMAGGAPPIDPLGPKMAQARQQLAEICKAARDFRMSGRYEVAPAPNKQARDARNHFKRTVLELINSAG